VAGNHLFVDGEYLRRAYAQTLSQVVPENEVAFENFDFEVLKKFAGASKIYFYDAVDESAADAHSRSDFLEAISHVAALHVRTGSVRPGKKNKPKQQKQVDVALAVDCLTQTFHKSVDTLTLVLGDIDFLPLVEVLVHQGAFVRILYEKRSASVDLLRSADEATELTLDVLWDLSSDAFRKACPKPIYGYNSPVSLLKEICKGTIENKTVTLYDNTERSSVVLGDHFYTEYNTPRVNGYICRDRSILEKYLAVIGKPVTWTE
jgi:uncharacterized LabA/DUF88 family protein